jgi:hypothetical protein
VAGAVVAGRASAVGRIVGVSSRRWMPSRSSTTPSPDEEQQADREHAEADPVHPFSYERFATGDLHAVSHSPYPWS